VPLIGPAATALAGCRFCAQPGGSSAGRRIDLDGQPAGDPIARLMVKASREPDAGVMPGDEMPAAMGGHNEAPGPRPDQQRIGARLAEMCAQFFRDAGALDRPATAAREDDQVG
jgi:hypothetical protein